MPRPRLILLAALALAGSSLPAADASAAKGLVGHTANGHVKLKLAGGEATLTLARTIKVRRLEAFQVECGSPFETIVGLAPFRAGQHVLQGPYGGDVRGGTRCRVMARGHALGTFTMHVI